MKINHVITILLGIQYGSVLSQMNGPCLRFLLQCTITPMFSTICPRKIVILHTGLYLMLLEHCNITPYHLHYAPGHYNSTTHMLSTLCSWNIVILHHIIYIMLLEHCNFTTHISSTLCPWNIVILHHIIYIMFLEHCNITTHIPSTLCSCKIEILQPTYTLPYVPGTL